MMMIVVAVAVVVGVVVAAVAGGVAALVAVAVQPGSEQTRNKRSRQKKQTDKAVC